MIKILLLNFFVFGFFYAKADNKCVESRSPFIVNQITKSPNDKAITINRGANGLIENFTLNLRTCIREQMRQHNPLNTPFVIEYYNSAENRAKDVRQKVEVMSDAQGCIQWQEIYRYKYKVKPLWIGLERTIKKEKGAFAGAEIIPMAVNPWLSDNDKQNGLPSILDTRCEYSRSDHIFDKKENYESDGLAYLMKTAKKERPLLWVPELDLQAREVSDKSFSSNPTQKAKDETTAIKQLLGKYQRLCLGASDKPCYKRTIQVAFYVPLKLRTLGMNNVEDNKLGGGTYDIETQMIISPNANEKNYLLSEEKCIHKQKDLNKTKKALNFICHFNLSFLVRSLCIS